MAKQKSRFPSYGLVRGPSHEQGGVAGMVAGEQPVELEGGEWIIPKEAVPDYLPVLKQITNEGRAMQQMQNGNSAMDALIASASMETGLAQPKSPMFMGGGMMDEYEGGGQLHSRRMYNQKDKKKYGYEMGGMMPQYQDGGKVKIDDYIKSGRSYSKDEYNDAYREYFGDKYGGGDVGLERAESYKYSPNALQKILDIIPGVGGKRAYQRASDYREQVFNNPEALMKREAELERGVNVSGRALREQSEVNDQTVKDMFMTGMLNVAAENPRNFSYRMNAESMDDTMADQFIQGSDIGYQVSDDDNKYKSIDPYNVAQSKAGRDLFGLIPVGYSGSVRKNPGINPQIDVASLRQQMENMRTAELIPSKEQGGMIKQYQQGGQMQPRKQQEIRNPQMYGPPDSLMGPDTTMGNLDDLLNYYMESDRRNKLNALTGDTIDPQLDSLRLLQRMKKSKMPRTGRKSMQKGGKVKYKMVGLESLENRFPNFDAPMSNPEFEAAMQYGQRGTDAPTSTGTIEEAIAQGLIKPQSLDSLMGNISEDKRIRPADNYEFAKNPKVKLTVPKLSSAYMQSMGIETPLSRRQRSLLQRKAIAPETLNPQVQSLLGRVLVQRLANEPI
jgi:hypothetical protein